MSGRAGDENKSNFRWKARNTEIYILCSCAKLLQSCLTRCDPAGSSVHGILQARTLEWAVLLQGIFPNPGVEPVSPVSAALAGRFFITSTVWTINLQVYKAWQKTPCHPTPLPTRPAHQVIAPCCKAECLEQLASPSLFLWMWPSRTRTATPTVPRQTVPEPVGRDSGEGRDWSWPVRPSPMSLTGRFWEEMGLERVRPEGKVASPEPQFSHLCNEASDSVALVVLQLIYMALQWRKVELTVKNKRKRFNIKSGFQSSLENIRSETCLRV